ncbi:MAG TPA: fused MFS/spermidine synthase [Vicinamibacteria bacterium]
MAEDPHGASRADVVLAGAIFCLSGAAALVYQVAWQRILVLHSGVGVYSVAMIVAAFLAGLGIGSHAGGVLSARVSARAALAIFAALELGVGAFGASSGYIYYDLLYARAPGLYDSPIRAGVAHFLALLPPTACMGMSLPFLVRAMVRDAADASRTIGLLYALNVAGAGAGALLAPWVLIRFFGIRGAVTAASLANVTVALGAAALLSGRRSRAPDTPSPAPASRPAAVGLGLWLAVYAASGFCALALEILWFRIVDVAVKATAFTFGTVLAVYLLGLAAGTAVGVRWASRLRQPLKAFLLCQCLILVYATVAVAVLVRVPPPWPGYRWFYEYWSWYDGYLLGERWDPLAFARLYVLLPFVLYGLPTMLMGFSFVALQRAVQDDARTSGRKVGLLQAANIAGCVAGSLVVGLAGLTRLGTTGSLRLLAAVGCVFAAVGVRRFGMRTPFAMLAALLAAVAVVMPGQRRLWLRLHGADGQTALVREDASSVVAITPGDASHWSLFVNGKGLSYLPFGGMHSVLGAVPAVVHGAPHEIAIIGLGSGDTAWAAACRSETRAVVVFEVSTPQPRLLAELAARHPMPDLQGFLADPRVTVRLEDGRNALQRGPRAYDVIEADALYPQNAYSGNLYSLEFFRRCAARLKAGGLMCSWAPTGRVAATFRAAFPHVVVFRGGEVLVGSNQPIAAEPTAWMARLETAQPYLGATVAEDTRAALRDHRVEPPASSAAQNRDLFPRDEFRTPEGSR